MTTFWHWLKDGILNIDWSFWKFMFILITGCLVLSMSLAFTLITNEFLLLIGLPVGGLICLYAFYYEDNNL